MIRKDIIDLFRVPPGRKVRLKDHDTGWAQTKEMKELGKADIKERARAILDKNLEDLAEAQELLYADDRYAVLIVLQALDAAGKDGHPGCRRRHSDHNDPLARSPLPGSEGGAAQCPGGSSEETHERVTCVRDDEAASTTPADSAQCAGVGLYQT